MRWYQMRQERGRRVMAILLSLLLILSMGMTAFAEEFPNADLIIAEDAFTSQEVFSEGIFLPDLLDSVPADEFTTEDAADQAEEMVSDDGQQDMPPEVYAERLIEEDPLADGTVGQSTWDEASLSFAQSESMDGAADAGVFSADDPLTIPPTDLADFQAAEGDSLIADTPQNYYENGTSKPLTGTYTEITSATTTWKTGWYVLKDHVTIDQRIEVTGDAILLLPGTDDDNTKVLDVPGGIHVPPASSLTIYGEGQYSGALRIINTETMTDNAAIGGNQGEGNGPITIYSGTVAIVINAEAAGIGGGQGASGQGITIHDGNIVIANSGKGAGIGGGSTFSAMLNLGGKDIVINGGNVNIQAASGAGIGGGYCGVGMNIAIHGGNIYSTSSEGAGIGGGHHGVGAGITITDGKIEAISENGGAGIGAGYEGSGRINTRLLGGDLTIRILGGTVKASSIVKGKALAYSGSLGMGIGMGIGGGRTDIPVEIYDGAKIRGGNFPNPQNVIAPKRTTDMQYVIIEPCQHENGTYTTTATTHKQECEDCRTTFSEEVHTYNANYICTVCGYQGQTYTVSFEANGGGGSMDSVKVIRDGAYILPECGFTAPQGKEFENWQIGETTFAAGDEITVSANTTVTAVWKVVREQYTVTIAPGEGSGEAFTLSSADTDNWGDNTAYGKFILSSDEKALFCAPLGSVFTAPEGKLFLGWKKDGDDTLYGEGDLLDAGTYTLTAQWESLKPEFKSHSLVLSGLIGINFFMDLPEIEGVNYEGSYMEFSVSGKDGKISKDDFDAQDKNETGETYGFTCYVTSIQMADEVTATFHYGEGKTVSETYSVAQYIEKFDSIRDKYDAATQAVVDAIADYGHFMQIVLARTNGWEIGKDHAEMAGSSSFLATAENLAAVKAAVSDHAFTWNVESSKIEDFTFDLTLDSSTTLRVFFTPEEGFAGEFTAYLSEGSKNLAVLQGNGRYLVTIPDIPAHLLGQKFMVSGQAGGEYYVILSPLTYIDTVLGLPAYQNDQDMQNAMVALYEYYRTVTEYRKR